MALIQTVLIAVVVLIILYFIINWLFVGSTQLTNMANGNEKQTILASTLKNNNNSSNYTYSTWFYVNDWNYRFGEPKILLGRLDANNNPSPSITFDAMENNITVSVSCYQHSTGSGTGSGSGSGSEGFTSMDSATSVCGSNDSILASTASVACINSLWQQAGRTPNLVATSDPTTLMDSNTKRPFPLYTSTLAQLKAIMPTAAQNKEICYPPTTAGSAASLTGTQMGSASSQMGSQMGSAPLGSAPLGSAPLGSAPLGSAPLGSAPLGSAQSSDNSMTHQCVMKNFPLQKWVNLLISVYGRTLDIYIDGKLVRTCILPGVAKVNASSNIVVTPNGGFSGWTSNFQYWDHATNPQEAYNIYKNGFGGSILGNLFNKYRIKFAFVKDNKEVSSIEI
jgi:hypothetical protein